MKLPPNLRPEENEALAQLRAEALQGVRTQARKACSYLTHAHPSYRATALHAVVHLALPEALPVLDAMVADAESAKYTIASAWLRAETEPAPEKKVRRLLSAFKLDTAQINEVTARPLPRPALDAVAQFPQEFYVLRALADLAYRYPESLCPLPELRGINFAADVRANTRWRYAPVPRNERAAALVQELSKIKIERWGDPYPYLEQLILDEGEAGRPALQKALDEKRAESRGSNLHPDFDPNYIVCRALEQTLAASQPGKRRQMFCGY